MASTISMNGNKKIETIQKEFTNKFPFLTLIFLDTNKRSLDISKTLSEVRKVKGDNLSISKSLKLNTLEKRFFENFGIHVEIAYQKKGKIFHSKENVNKTLSEFNDWCFENECDEFKFKRKFTGNTLLSLQEQLYESIKEYYPNAQVKKINKDNFVDIHLPEIHEKKGTHLFFNTAKEGIKIGFYCRDELFNTTVLERSKNIEKYSQGIRILNNPLFENIDDAIDNTIYFLREISNTQDEINENQYSDEDTELDISFETSDNFNTNSTLVLILGNVEEFNSNSFISTYYNIDVENDGGETQSYLYSDSLEYIKINNEKFAFGFDYVNINFENIDNLINEIENINIDDIWFFENNEFYCLSNLINDSTSDLKEKISDYYNTNQNSNGIIMEVVSFSK